MSVHKRSPWEINSTIRNVQARPSTFLWRSVVLRLIPPSRLTFLSRLLNGRSLMLTWQLMKRSRESISRSRWRIRKIRDPSSRLFKLLRTLFTPHLWSVLSRSWSVWSFRMLTMRSSTITDTTLRALKTLQAPSIAQCSLFGVSQLRDLVRSTLPQSAGTLDTVICSLLAMVLMTSWSKTLVSFVVSP